MTDIASLPKISPDEVKQLRRNGVSTIGNLWARIGNEFSKDDLGACIGRDFDRGIDQLVKQTGMTCERLMELLIAESFREAEVPTSSANNSPAITPQEVARLRSLGIKTVTDLWAFIGKDFDHGIDLLAADLWPFSCKDLNQGSDILDKDRKLHCERLTKRLTNWLADQAVCEARYGEGSHFVRHASLFGMLLAFGVIGMGAWIFFTFVLPPMGLRGPVIVAARDLEGGRALRTGDLYSTQLLPNTNYFTTTNQLEGLILAAGVAHNKPLRFEDVLRPQVVASVDISADTIIASNMISVTWSPYQQGAVTQPDQVVGRRTHHAFRKGQIIPSEFLDQKSSLGQSPNADASTDMLAQERRSNYLCRSCVGHKKPL